MKRFIITVVAILMAVTLNAQDVHLKFKGIPLDGDYKVFAQKLIQKGFKQLDATADGILLSGNFMAIPDVIVLVYPDPASKAVSMVSAMIKAGDSWSAIENKYQSIVSTYKEKYGEPSGHVEEFDSDSTDFARLIQIRENRGNYKSIWETIGGRIVITHVYFNYDYYISCTYVDEQNERALHQTIIDDI